MWFLLVGAASQCWGDEFYTRQGTWTETLLMARERLAQAPLGQAELRDAAVRTWYQLKEDFPVQWDWTLQDGGEGFPAWFLPVPGALPEREMFNKVLAELGAADAPFREQQDTLIEANAAPADRRWLELYAAACERRRALRLRTVLAQAPRLVFSKHPTVRPSFFAYTEGQSDAQHERHFRPGAELCLLEFEGLYGKVRTLVSDPSGAIRDPAVSWDGKRVLFAWKKSLDEDDYHIYELDTVSGRVRQVTTGIGFADYEPAWLPNGDIIFTSTRCVQTVDCWWTEVSNLYTCDAKGCYMRRLGFDQVHTVYPQMLDDGRVIYTRWDYNDRGQIFTQALFQMRPDGTGQVEFYGNNSWFPTTIAHARGIPGTQKVMAILCGHHSSQAGKLAVIDPAQGRQENTGVQLIAPVRATPAVRIDSYGQEGPLWQYPYPLNERECLTGFAPLGWDRPAQRQGDADFGIYWMDSTGHRELLAWDGRVPCSQPVPLVARVRPQTTPTTVDYQVERGTFYVRDIYAGDGLAGVPRGTIKRLRAVALAFRAAGVGHNGSAGPGGGALVSTPVAIGNGTWDVKIVLGEATVHEDGSALFTVPARTPIYFQALDERGYAVQTMRSWSTLQPGEFLGCAGCHESKNAAPSPDGYRVALAMQAGPQHLGTSADKSQGFSFPRLVQPILDRRCTECHHDREPVEKWLRSVPRRPLLATKLPAGGSQSSHAKSAFSLLGTENLDSVAKRKWSDAYLVLTRAHLDSEDETRGSFRGDCRGKLVNWIGSQSPPELLPPWSGGAARSGLLKTLEAGHNGVELSRTEFQTLACWIDLLVPYCGDYLEANAWGPEDLEKYQRYAAKRVKLEEAERSSLQQMMHSSTPPLFRH